MLTPSFIYMTSLCYSVTQTMMVSVMRTTTELTDTDTDTDTRK